MLKKIRPSISLLAATTMVFSTIGSINIQARNKGTYPGNNTILIGDVVMPFTVPNVINGMTYAISRGADPDNLKVIYSKKEGTNPQYYYDFGDEFNTSGDGVGDVGDDLWKKSKIYWDPASAKNNKPEPYEFNNNTPVPTSSSTAIKPRTGYEGIITVDLVGKKVTIPANTTPNILKGAIQSDDGVYGQKYYLFTDNTLSTKLADDAVLATGNALNVISEDGRADDIYNLVVQSGGGGGQEDSADLEFKTNLDQGTLSYTAGAADVDPLTVEVQGKDGATTGTISYQWYKQTVGTSPLRATAVPVGEAIEGETSASFTPPVNAVGTTLYYVIATNTEEGKKASSIASKMVTVVVSEGELVEDTDFTVDDYVYNMASDKVETMGKLTGTAPSKAKITIEANFEEIATTDAKEDGTWEATFPRQNAGTKLKVTLNADGKIATIVKEVKKADDKALDDFRKSIDLNKLIEVRDNLYLSKDKGATGIKAADLKDKAANDPDPVSLKDGDYYIEDDRNAVKAFKVYVDLIEAVLGYKYQISDVDLKYIQNIAIPTLETYKDKIQQVNGDKVTTYELKLSVGGNKQGTVTIKDKDAGAIVGDTSSVTNGVYTINNGKTVTITAIPNAQNTLAGWSIDKEFSKDNNTTREEKVTKDKSVEAVFASPEEATKIDEVIKEIEEITANGTKPFEVSISETAPSEDKIKATVEAAIKEILPEGAEVKGVVLEEIPTRATTKNYKATVTFKVGDIEFTITIEISVKVDSSITNVTANVTKSVYDKTNKGTKFDLNLNPYVEGITKTDITLTDGEGKEVGITSVTEVGTSGAKYYEVLAKLTKDIEYTIKVTKDGYNISTAKVTGLDEDSSTPTPVTASVTKAVYDKTNEGTKFDLNLTPYVEGITKTDITLTDGEGNKANVTSITEAGTGETKYYEVLAKLTKDVNYTIKVAKDGYDISTATVKGLDADSSTPDEKGDFVQIKSFVIANDAEVNTSVEQIVYQKTVGESASQAVYKIYAKLSNPVANFSVGDTSVKFNLDLSATVTKNNVTTDYPDLLNGLRFNNVTRVLMKELSEDNSKLEITLDLDGVGESEDKATTHTINFKWVEPNKADVTGDPLKALKFKAYKFKK